MQMKRIMKQTPYVSYCIEFDSIFAWVILATVFTHTEVQYHPALF